MATETATTIDVLMAIDKETKGAIRYAEIPPEDSEDDPLYQAAIGTLYLRKTSLREFFGTAPQKIRATVEAR